MIRKQLIIVVMQCECTLKFVKSWNHKDLKKTPTCRFFCANRLAMDIVPIYDECDTFTNQALISSLHIFGKTSNMDTAKFRFQCHIQ